MRSLKDLLSALRAVGLPYTQIQWPQGKAPDLPYAVLVPDGTSNRFADGSPLCVPVGYTVEVYTRERDVPLEKRVQAALDDAGIGWQRYHTTDPDGPVVLAVYSMTLTE